MQIKIYQINSKRDPGMTKFMGLARMKSPVDPASYDEVFSGDVDCMNLEDVFAKFNTEGHPLHRGHSLSVSDVVLTEDGAFYCDTFGFKDIDFDESKVQKPDDLLKIVYVEPNRPPFLSEAGNDLKSLQRAVDGHIETVYMGDSSRGQRRFRHRARPGGLLGHHELCQSPDGGNSQISAGQCGRRTLLELVRFWQ